MSQNQDDRRHDDPIQDAQREFIVTERPEGVAPSGPRGDETGAKRPRDREPGGSVSAMNLIIASALALIFGLLGAWAYDAFVAGTLEAEKNQASAGEAEQSEQIGDRTGRSAPDSEDKPDLDTAIKAEAARIDQLAEQVDRLRETVDAEETGTDPGINALGNRIAKIEDRVSDLEPLTQALEGLAQQSREQSGRMDAIADTVDGLESDLTTLKDRVGGTEGIGGGLLGQGTDAREKPLTTGSGPEPDGEAPPNPEDRGGTAETTLEQGIGQFKADDFEEARETFFELLEQEPSDARIWYYAALANGKATGQWKGETERLVLQGVEREQAGTPSKSVIDAAFADLAERQGSEWLAYYRRRADE